MPASHEIILHDTTLRDGEQMAGVVFNFDEKIKLAEKSIEFGTDLIDIMPTVSDGEFRVAKELAKRFGGKISATCRRKKEDIDVAVRAGVSRVTLFAPLSDLHIAQKLKITREENRMRSLEMIDYAKAHGLIVDFAGEDASRASLEYLKQFLDEIHEKISVFFIADTVGCLMPESTRKLVWFVKNNSKCCVGLHMHNDFGMASANTVEGLLAGACCFSGTFTGIGERAGNAPIEEVCAALRYLHSIELELNYGMLKEICDDVQKFSGIALPKHKPIVGENAFSHESGIHVDGVLKNPKTYEFIEPEAVGQKRKILFGKHSGKQALQYILKNRVISEEISPESMESILKELKAIFETKKSVSEEDVLDAINSLKREKEVTL